MANPVEIATICLNPARKRNPRGPRSGANSSRDRIARTSGAQLPLNKHLSVLFTSLSPQYRWPGQTRSEVIHATTFTQNASWATAERPLAKLHGTGRLGPKLIEKASLSRLERLIRPSAGFPEEARKLRNFPLGRHIEERR